jgi:multisubunit Na+/H+ antiporter MnhG subunit
MSASPTHRAATVRELTTLLLFLLTVPLLAHALGRPIEPIRELFT